VVSYDQPLAKPQAMVTSATIHVLASLGGGATVATLEPGFPVQVTQYATDGGARWAHIRWQGPTKMAGGAGWALASQLKAPGARGTSPVGDLAALSPGVAASASAAGPGFAAWIGFPDSGYTYRDASSAQVVTLGQQIIPVVLVADFGLSLAAQQPSTMPQNLANRDPGALTFIFLSINKNTPLGSYLTSNHVTGFHIASDPTTSTVSIQDLGAFYAALTEAPLLNTNDQRQVFALLVGGNPDATTYASASMIGAGALMVTTIQTAKGFTTIVAGQLRPSGSPAVAVSAISSDQPTAAKSQAALQGFFKSLLATIASAA
jgi:hypothetical protein